MALDFFAWQSAEREGDLHQVVERERKARRKKIRADSLKTFVMEHLVATAVQKRALLCLLK